MSSTHDEIAALEEQLRQAELGPDPKVFEELLADDVVLTAQNGDGFAKATVVAAHQPGAGPKFTRVDMKDLSIVDHGSAAVVTCHGIFQTAQATIPLRFMRVWLKRNGRWQIIAGAVWNG